MGSTSTGHFYTSPGVIKALQDAGVLDHGLVWHYTTAEGLLGIVQRQELWASSVRYLNDAEELSFGRNCLHDAAEQVVQELGGVSGVDGEMGGGFSLAGQMVVATQKNPGTDEPTVTTPEAYAVSFCTNGDLLSQWRGYGQGSGFAIGLDPGKLPMRTQDGDRVTFEPVVYGRKAAINALAEEIRSGLDADNDLDDPALMAIFATFGHYKHEAFEEEAEHRLIITDPVNPPLLRTRGPGLLPYLVLPLPAEAIRHVRVGPGGGELQRAAVERLLARECVGALVTISRAPYRRS